MYGIRRIDDGTEIDFHSELRGEPDKDDALKRCRSWELKGIKCKIVHRDTGQEWRLL